MSLKTSMYASKQNPDWKVRAVQLTEKNIKGVAKWAGQWTDAEYKERVLKNGEVRDQRIVVKTPQGPRSVRIGQFLIRDVSEHQTANARGNWYEWFVRDADDFLKAAELVK